MLNVARIPPGPGVQLVERHPTGDGTVLYLIRHDCISRSAALGLEAASVRLLDSPRWHSLDPTALGSLDVVCRLERRLPHGLPVAVQLDDAGVDVLFHPWHFRSIALPALRRAALAGLSDRRALS